MDRVEIETWDLDEAAQILRDQYTAKIGAPGGDTVGLRVVQDPLGGVFLSCVQYFMHAEFTVDEPMSHTYITSLRSGLLSYRMGPTRDLARQENDWGPGNVFMSASAGGTFEATMRDSDVEFAAIDPATFAAVARTADGAPVALTGYKPVSVQAKRSWLATLDFARQTAALPDVTSLVAGTTARLLAATALATFPSNAVLDPTIEDRRDSRPLTVRRAVAFMESHPDDDLSVVDIARAAFVTPRALQLAFRRHLDTTPLRYLKQVRLDRARADLQAADPGCDTVTGIAARWGWGSPSRFAADYFAAYGQHPRQTLNS